MRYGMVWGVNSQTCEVGGLEHAQGPFQILDIIFKYYMHFKFKLLNNLKFVIIFVKILIFNTLTFTIL